jgi:predicted nuclease with RNAse H fold
MRLGFALFAALGKGAPVYEVFPSASYTLLKDCSALKIGVQLNAFAQGPKDMLDAYVAAATVREFVEGRGSSVGGGDGLGEIILPRPVPQPIEGVFRWPGGAK